MSNEMEKMIKAARLKLRIALENIKSLERFMKAFSPPDAVEIPEALESFHQHKEDFFTAMEEIEELDDSDDSLESCIIARVDMEERCQRLKAFLVVNLPTDSIVMGNAALPLQTILSTNESHKLPGKVILKQYGDTRFLIREYWRKLHLLPAVQSPTIKALNYLVEEFTRLINGLIELKEPIEEWNATLFNIFLLKFDSETRMAWEQHSIHLKEDTFQELLHFVEDRIRILRSTERSSIDKADTPINVAGNCRKNAPRTAIINTAPTHRFSGTLQPRCLLKCSENHPLSDCPVFNGKDVNHRRDIAAKQLCSWNCLSNAHLAKDCKSDQSCRTCGERHHSLLHITSTTSMGVNSEEETDFLETATSHPIDYFGKSCEERALLDSGSMSNLISEAFARQLIVFTSNINIPISGIGMVSQSVDSSVVAAIQLKNQLFSIQMAFVMLNISSADIPTTSTDITFWMRPADEMLADPSFYISGKIDIVIAGDEFWQRKKRSLGKGLPWLVETTSGWLVAADIAQVATEAPRICHVATSDTPQDAVLGSSLRFWVCETLPNDTACSTADLHEKHYVSRTTRHAARGLAASVQFGQPGSFQYSYPKAQQPLAAQHPLNPPHPVLLQDQQQSLHHHHQYHLEQHDLHQHHHLQQHDLHQHHHQLQQHQQQTYTYDVGRRRLRSTISPLLYVGKKPPPPQPVQYKHHPAPQLLPRMEGLSQQTAGITLSVPDGTGSAYCYIMPTLQPQSQQLPDGLLTSTNSCGALTSRAIFQQQQQPSSSIVPPSHHPHHSLASAKATLIGPAILLQLPPFPVHSQQATVHLLGPPSPRSTGPDGAIGGLVGVVEAAVANGGPGPSGEAGALLNEDSDCTLDDYTWIPSTTGSASSFLPRHPKLILPLRPQLLLATLRLGF